MLDYTFERIQINFDHMSITVYRRDKDGVDDRIKRHQHQKVSPRNMLRYVTEVNRLRDALIVVVLNQSNGQVIAIGVFPRIGV